MRNRRLLCSLTTFGLLLTAIATPDRAFAKRIEGLDQSQQSSKPKEKIPKTLWVMQQETDGEVSYTVCFSDDSFKFVAGSLILIARKPDWKVHVINARAKVRCEIPLKDFTGLDCIERYDVKKLDAAPVKEGSEPVLLASQAATEYGGNPEYSAEKIKHMGFTAKKINVWTASKVTVPQSSLTVLSRLYGLEGLKGVPLRIQMITDKDEEIDCLSTNWCLHREMTNNFFDVPTNFKTCKNAKELLANKTVVSVRDTMGVGRRIKHKPRSPLPLVKSGASNPAAQKPAATSDSAAVTKLPQQK